MDDCCVRLPQLLVNVQQCSTDGQFRHGVAGKRRTDVAAGLIQDFAHGDVTKFSSCRIDALEHSGQKVRSVFGDHHPWRSPRASRSCSASSNPHVVPMIPATNANSTKLPATDSDPMSPDKFSEACIRLLVELAKTGSLSRCRSDVSSKTIGGVITAGPVFLQRLHQYPNPDRHSPAMNQFGRLRLPLSRNGRQVGGHHRAQPRRGPRRFLFPNPAAAFSSSPALSSSLASNGVFPVSNS